MYYVLYYQTIENYIEKRVPFRELHLAYATASQDRGELLLGGAFSEPNEGSLMIFQTEDPSVVVDFAKNDPYVINGLVFDWNVRGWDVIIGN